MPTVLVQAGWRLFFYANEGNESCHVHCRKAEIECKFWLDTQRYEVHEAYSYGLSPKDRREIRKIVFEHFDYLQQQWLEFQQRR